MVDPLKQIGRLAFREADGLWHAYYAMPDTMEGALLLGSIQLAIVIGHPNRKETFMCLMREAVGDIIEQEVGSRPVWKEPKAAPFWERHS